MGAQRFVSQGEMEGLRHARGLAEGEDDRAALPFQMLIEKHHFADRVRIVEIIEIKNDLGVEDIVFHFAFAPYAEIAGYVPEMKGFPYFLLLQVIDFLHADV